MGSGSAKCMAGTAAAFVLAGMVASSLLTRRHEGLCTRLERFVDENARPASAVRARTPLHGEAHGGDALVFYAAADRQWRGATRAFGGWSRPDLDVQSRDVVWTAIEPIVATLRVGAAAGCIARGPGPNWFELQALLQFAQRRAAARSEWTDAVQLWLDEQALLGDAGWWWRRHDSLAVWTADELSALPAPDAATLAEGLRRLDAELAIPDDPIEALVWTVSDALQRTRTGGASLRNRLLSWSSGFDPGRHELLGIEELIEALPALLPPAAPWPQRCRQWQRFVGRVGSVQGRFVLGWATHTREVERLRRLTLARVRLLRLALAFTVGEPLPALADPFAEGPFADGPVAEGPFAEGPFACERDGDVASFRSAAAPQVLEVRALRR